MKIKNRLYMSAGVSIVLCVMLLSLVLVTSGRIAEASNKYELLDDVGLGISELDIVTYDYLLHREERMEQQWNSKYNSLGEILEEADEEVMGSISADYAALGDLFSQVTANYEKIQKLIQEGASQEEIDAAILLEERLVAQLLIKSHSLITDASRLSEGAQAEVTGAQRLAANSTLILMTLLAIVVTTSSLLVARRISKPLDELTKGAEIIGKGDLEHKVWLKTKDELGQLAAAFNEMTERLKTTTASRDELEREVTERKQAEEEIKAQKKFTDNVIDSLPDTFYIFDPESGKGIQWNKTLSEISGYNYEEMNEYPPLHFYPPEEHQLIEEVVKTTLEKGRATVELKYIIADGTRIPFEYSTVLIKNAEGKPWICAIGRDITERKQMEEKLVRSERLAVLGQLAGGVGHELRNPLGAIKNAAYFLNMVLEEPEPEVKETLEILDQEVATSERIISSLLDFARQKPPVRRNVDITEVIQEVLSRASVPENIEVVSRMDATLPEIMADPDHLDRVFTNIILNAVQAMPEGGQLTIESQVPSPGWVAASFTDTGVGIPDEILARLFEPLFTTRAKGIGLGLAITKTLVEGHGGTIEVQSEMGQGSTFTVRLPLGMRKED